VRRVPTRTCVACRTPRAKRELVRVVRRPDGTVAVDETGRLPGRGAYLCRDAACFDRAGRRRALGHALRTEIPADVEHLIAAGPAGLAAATTHPMRADGPPHDTLHHTTIEGGAHGQE
jgi:predicted RNA-binding protein YlxR (DUF448 family)